MPARFKVDEDLPAEIAERLRAVGYDAVTVREQSLCGVEDSRLWELVQHEARCLMTADKGFGATRKALPGTHNGLVLLRLSRESRAGYLRLLESFLAGGFVGQTTGRVVSVSPDSIRVMRET